MPATFEEVSIGVGKAGRNLDLIKGNLDTMSESVALIPDSLAQYQAMLIQSHASMDNLRSMLANVQTNLPAILHVATIAVGLFLAWLLASQVVILSQGWELYHGTADRMEGSAPQPGTARAPGSE